MIHHGPDPTVDGMAIDVTAYATRFSPGAPGPALRTAITATESTTGASKGGDQP